LNNVWGLWRDVISIVYSAAFKRYEHGQERRSEMQDYICIIKLKTSYLAINMITKVAEELVY